MSGIRSAGDSKNEQAVKKNPCLTDVSRAGPSACLVHDGRADSSVKTPIKNIGAGRWARPPILVQEGRADPPDPVASTMAGGDSLFYLGISKSYRISYLKTDLALHLVQGKCSFRGKHGAR